MSAGERGQPASLLPASLLPTSLLPASLLIVGCGNMGGAMLAGWLAGGMAPASITVVDRSLAAAPAGVRLRRSLADLAGERFAALLLGVKPQALAAIAPELAPVAGAGTVVLSMLAGVGLDRLAALFPDADGLVRVMPNLAAAIGRSPIALAARGVVRREAVTALMAPLGTPAWIEEPAFDAFTALAGSGPAFVYRFIDALAQAGAALGLGPDEAGRLALAMVEGAALLAAGSSDPPATLALRVASPGGTTEAGLRVLDADDALARLIAGTLAAAAARSAALATELSGVTKPDGGTSGLS